MDQVTDVLRLQLYTEHTVGAQDDLKEASKTPALRI